MQTQEDMNDKKQVEVIGDRCRLSRDDADLLYLELIPTQGEALFIIDETGLTALEEAVVWLGKQEAKGLVVHGNDRGFIAGADVGLIYSIQDPKEALAFSRRGQSCFQAFQDLPFPTMAAIHGPCLGGGLELALALDHRIASRHPSTKLGLPEVRLGILPGFGGTQRLPLLVGLPGALDLMLKGSTLDGKRALRKGLVEGYVPEHRLVQRAAEILTHPARRKTKLCWRDHMLTFTRLGRRIVRKKVEKSLTSGPARFLPAPGKLLEVTLAGLVDVGRGAYDAEAQALADLATGPECKNLVRLFFGTEQARKLDRKLLSGLEDKHYEKVRSALVIGGGVMGAGIAGLMAEKGLSTRLVDLSEDQLGQAMARHVGNVNRKQRRRRLQPHEAQAAKDRLTASTKVCGYAQADVFLEAVAENLDLKKRLFREAAAKGREDLLLATNTSSLSLGDMAADLPHPEQLVGLHFFNPPEKMPLIEIIAQKQSSPKALARACELATRLGKYPVLVQDGPGFLVNRCLAPYLGQAVQLCEEGVAPALIDRVAEEQGMPMGPLRLLDEIGWDVAAKVCDVLAEAWPARMSASPLFAHMVEAGLLGRKSGKGVYVYGTKSKDRPGHASALQHLIQDKGLARASAHAPSKLEIRERLFLPILTEAVRCLEEGVVSSEDELDFAMVMGIGYPPHLGGPIRAARSDGVETIVARLSELVEAHGPLFEAPRMLIEMSQEQTSARPQKKEESHVQDPR